MDQTHSLFLSHNSKENFPIDPSLIFLKISYHVLIIYDVTSYADNAIYSMYTKIMSDVIGSVDKTGIAAPHKM